MDLSPVDALMVSVLRMKKTFFSFINSDKYNVFFYNKYYGIYVIVSKIVKLLKFKIRVAGLMCYI